MCGVNVPAQSTCCRLQQCRTPYKGSQALALYKSPVSPSHTRRGRTLRKRDLSRPNHVTYAVEYGTSHYNFGTQTLQDGCSGDSVAELQRYLHDQGYFPRLRETPDGYTGYFGDLTTEALTAWQEDCHLIADGCFGQSSRQAVMRQQEERLLEHARKQQMVQQAPVKQLPVQHQLSPVQIGGIAFLLGGVLMFAYQALSWRRRRPSQEDMLEYDEPEPEVERQQYRGKWQGTLTNENAYARTTSSTRASSSTSSSLPTHIQRARSPGTVVSLPSLNPGPADQCANNPRLSSPSVDPAQFSDAAGPAVSIEGYPRYNPQWGTGLPEPKNTSKAAPTRREPSSRAKSVMARPGSPGYKAAAAPAATNRPPARSRPEAPGHVKRITPEEAEHARQQAYSKRPRSPQPTAMPESLQTPPPLKPELDPSAKSWIQIAVGQRGPKGSEQPNNPSKSSQNGNRAQGNSNSPGHNGSRAQGTFVHGSGQNSSQGQGISAQGRRQQPGSPGSGVAQILSVDEERLVDDRAKRPPQNGNGNGSGASVHGASSNGHVQKPKNAGVSLFGSYKAPKKD